MSALPPGARLGPYQIQSAIGAGGMGEVYKAVDTRLDRVVAIKTLPSALASDPQFRQRFDREARTISQLDHPHICSLYDVGEHEGTAYLVMQYLDGETLDARLKARALSDGARGVNRPGLSLDEALKIATQIAGALDRAHRAGVVHRDLKPANVMLTKSGVKLLDFGLAKTALAPPADDASMTQTSPADLTASGMVLGTLRYMSPEQVEGHEADARSDIFAFGALVYEMVTGRKAFEGRSQASLIAAILDHDPPPMTGLQPLAPRALERVVRQCLAKSPDDRWQSAHDLAAELTWIGDGSFDQTALAEPHAGRRRGWLSGVVLFTLGAVVAGAAVWLLAPRQRLSERPFHSAIPLDTTAVLTPVSSRNPVAISPDGQNVVLSAVRDGIRRLFIRSVSDSTLKEIPETEGGDDPSFSPDNQWVVFFAGGALKRVAVSGGAPQTLTPALDVRGASWGSDGFIVFAPRRNTGLARVPVSGGAVETLTTINEAEREKSHRFPQVLPGGKAVLFTIGQTDILSFDDARIAVLSLDTRRYKTVVSGGMFARYVASGHLLYARGAALHAARFDLQRLEVVGPAVPVLDHLGMSAQFGFGGFDVSQAGTLAYVPAPRTARRDRVVAVDQAGKRELLLDTEALVEDIAPSPDGTRLALNLGGANDSVWLHDVARKTTTRLSFHAGDTRSPTWSRDGQYVTYGTAFPFGLTSTAADGSAREQALLSSSNETAYGAWSPNGQHLAYADIDPRTGYDLWTFSVADRAKHPFLQTRFNETTPAFSPDGRWLAYTSDEAGHDEVYVRPFPGPGGKWQVSTSGGSTPLWSPNGREIFYRQGSAIMRVALSTSGRFSAGIPRVHFESGFVSSDTGAVRAYGLMPDGKRLVIVERRQADVPQHVNLILNWLDDLKRRMGPAR